MKEPDLRGLAADITFHATLGIMAIVILWLYWSSLALLAGAEINAILSKMAEKPHDSALP